MMNHVRFACVVLLAAAFGAGSASVVTAQDSFEVKSIKAVRPTLVATANALQKGDIKAAKDAFDAYDSAWNGVEVYINVRSMEMYNALEREMQSNLTKGLNAPDANAQSLLPQARAMLAKFDEAIKMVQQGKPLNALYDDVARLRIVRAHLREVNPALKAGNLAKARKSFEEFSDQWDSIEDLVRDRSQQAYDGIEGTMANVTAALAAATPNADQVSKLVSSIMDEYNKIVAEITKDARGQ